MAVVNTIQAREDQGRILEQWELDGNFLVKVEGASHGRTVGQAVLVDGTLAQADAVATLADGIVAIVTSAADGPYYICTQSGKLIKWTAHGHGAAGTQLWLSQATAGLITTTEPASGIVQPLGKVVDANTILFRLGFVA